MIAAAKDNVSTPHPLVSIAEARLQASPYYSIRKIFCMYNEGMLVLRGRLPSFYHKQVAQAAVAGIQGVEQVVNQIEVQDWTT